MNLSLFLLSVLLLALCNLANNANGAINNPLGRLPNHLSAFPVKNVEIMQKFNEFTRNFSGSFNLRADYFNNFTSTRDEPISNCAEQLLTYLGGLTTYEWAMKMMDATGKIEPGLLEGNIFSLGAFDECLAIRNELVVNPTNTDLSITIGGQYCLGSMTIFLSEKYVFYFNWGACLPAACSAEELNQLIQIPLTQVVFTENLCQTHDRYDELDAADIVTIVILSIIGLIALLSTAYDLYLEHTSQKSSHQILLAFSVWTNGRKLFSTAKSSDQLECISGIRTITMMWIIYAHSFAFITSGPISNYAYFAQFFDDGWTMYIRNGTVSVDTFFLLSGIVLMYVYLKSTKEDQVWFNVFAYYLHRYIRLTPAMAIAVLVSATIIRHFGSGPLHPALDPTIEFCQTNWWTNLLYINNFVKRDELCLGQTWYLAVDMQLFLLSPLVLMPIRRWRKAAIGLIAMAACASLTCSFIMAWFMELDDSTPLNANPEVGDRYNQYYYFATYNRASPWLIGLITGFVIHKTKTSDKKYKINKLVNIVLWALSLAVLLTCLFYDNKDEGSDRVAMSFHVTFVRSAWAIALAYIIFACVNGYGGIVNWFLSLDIFQILGRLTYSMYLVHCSIIFLVLTSNKSTITLSHEYLAYNFWSLYMACMFTGIAWTLLFESPIIMLEKGVKSKPKAKPAKSG